MEASTEETREATDAQLSVEELREIWPALTAEERVEAFHSLPEDERDDFFLSLQPLGQSTVLKSLPRGERRQWLRVLAPDDAADVLQELDEEEREQFLAMLDEHSRREVTALLYYAEDAAGGLMSPRYVRVRPEMTIDGAIQYVRKQARDRVETIYYLYVLDAEQRLRGVLSFREIFASPPDALVRDVMNTEFVSVTEDMDQEDVAKVIAAHDLLAVPVLDAEGRLKGIVTVDDIVDVVLEEATEDIQKMGGVQRLDRPYFQTGFLEMLRKRGGWLIVLFLGEMLTANAMAHYEEEIAAAVVLAVFIPLIIASGGNSGAQASTLITRAMALGQVRLSDWWRVVYRELGTGLALGLILALIGLLRVVIAHHFFDSYSEHYLAVGLTVSFGLMGVVAWGTLAGSLLPMVLERLRFDPATASAPFVATLVDVTGLVIYFSFAQLLLGGTML